MDDNGTSDLVLVKWHRPALMEFLRMVRHQGYRVADDRVVIRLAKLPVNQLLGEPTHALVTGLISGEGKPLPVQYFYKLGLDYPGLLKEMISTYKDAGEAIGDDHAVNICNCSEQDIWQQLTAALAAVEGRPIASDVYTGELIEVHR